MFIIIGPYLAALPVYRLLSDASVKRIAFQLIYLAGTFLAKTTATVECNPFKLIYSWKCLNYNLSGVSSGSFVDFLRLKQRDVKLRRFRDSFASNSVMNCPL